MVHCNLISSLREKISEIRGKMWMFCRQVESHQTKFKVGYEARYSCMFPINMHLILTVYYFADLVAFIGHCQKTTAARLYHYVMCSN